MISDTLHVPDTLLHKLKLDGVLDRMRSNSLHFPNYHDCRFMMTGRRCAMASEPTVLSYFSSIMIEGSSLPADSNMV